MAMNAHHRGKCDVARVEDIWGSNFPISSFRYNMFRVVAFSDAPEVAVISQRWWTAGLEDGANRKPQGFVFWPPVKTSGAVDRLLKAHAEPIATGTGQWTRHPAASLFATDDLLLARKKALQAEDESDLTSEAEPVETAARIRRPNPRFEDDSDEETGTPARREPNGLSRPPPPPRTFGLNGSGGQGASMGMRRPSSDPTSAATPTSSATPTSAARQQSDARQTIILAKILKLVEGLVNGVNRNGANIEALREEVSTSKTRPQKLLPIETLTQLDDVDEQLRSRVVFNQLVEQLSGCCTSARSDLERNVRSMMRMAISDSLAEHLSLKGKNGKRPIAGTTLFDVICETLRRCGGANRDAVGKCVGLWLSGSRDRSGKRLKRMKAAAAADAGPAAAGPSVATDRPPLRPLQSDAEVQQPDVADQLLQQPDEEAELPMEDW